MKRLAVLLVAMVAVFGVNTMTAQSKIKLNKVPSKGQSEQKVELSENDLKEMEEAAAEFEREVSKTSDAQWKELDNMSDEQIQKEQEESFLKSLSKEERAEFERLAKSGDLGDLNLTEEEIKHLEAEEKAYIESLSDEERRAYMSDLEGDSTSGQPVLKKKK